MRSFGRRLRLLLLLVAFIGGQLAMLAHAAEAHDEAEAEGHVCLLCLAGHDLQSDVPPAHAGSLILPVTPCQCATATPSERPEIAVVRRKARSPPLT